jgi:MPBQ/MSBQ methyltransferase
VRPAGRLARALADLWMLFPEQGQYRDWFERAGFEAVTLRPVAPDWYRNERGPYAVAVAGTKPAVGDGAAAGTEPAAGAAPLIAGPPTEDLQAPLRPRERLRVAARFAAGSLAGAAFIPIALLMTARARLGRRS